MKVNNPIEIAIDLEEITLSGRLRLPNKPFGIVIFAHGSGSSRFSPRNNFVAEILNQIGLATLLFDLLTPAEESVDEITREFRFNIPLLANRLLLITQWVKQQPKTQHLPIGYFGASTGASAALIAAAQDPSVKAIVSRGGRVDLAGDYLSKVQGASLFIVGELDPEVIQLNLKAQENLQCPNELKIINGASHLFEEPGTLDQVTELAKQWFKKYLLPTISLDDQY